MRLADQQSLGLQAANGFAHWRNAGLKPRRQFVWPIFAPGSTSPRVIMPRSSAATMSAFVVGLPARLPAIRAACDEVARRRGHACAAGSA